MLSSETTLRPSRLTQGMLLCGIAFAPLFLIVVFGQAFTRRGFDLRRVPLSLLDLGDLGWIQIANFILSGLLAAVAALGFRRSLAGARGGTWGPLLIATCGLGLILAGIFHPDPGYSFPPGAPAGMSAKPSAHAMVHNIGFLIVVLSLITACFVFSRGFRSRGHGGWANYSVATGIAAPILIAVGIATNTILLFTVMAVVTFGWVSAIAARTRAQQDLSSGNARSTQKAVLDARGRQT